jgi:hypothetical protein
MEFLPTDDERLTSFTQPSVVGGRSSVVVFDARYTMITYATRITLITLLTAVLFSLQSLPSRADERVNQNPPAACMQASAVPIEECIALVELFNTTEGPGWRQNTNWLNMASALSPCDWYGVGCLNGHVVELSLARNRLAGSLPRTLERLPNLQRLDLAGNQLIGQVPPLVCSLIQHVQNADLSYNGLSNSRADLQACLDTLDPGWQSTQTVPPQAIRPAQINNNAVLLNWLPVAVALPGSVYEISYSEQFDGPFIIEGRTADTQASSFTINGLSQGTTYFVRVQTITPASVNNPDELASIPIRIPITTQGAVTTLLMVYFPADNDLDNAVDTVIERIRLGTVLNPNVQVVMFTDRSGDADSELFTISNGQIILTQAVEARWGQQEVNSADPEVLAWFLRYARTTYPANREIVSLMGHGLALSPELIWPTEGNNGARTAAAGQGQPLPMLPKGLEATAGDTTNRDYMSVTDLGNALRSATDNGANPFAIIFFDQCFQGNLDILYEVRNAAEYFIASPNYAWLSAPYDRYLPAFQPSATVQEIASSIINIYQRSLNPDHPNVIFALRSSDIEAVAAAVSDLGSALGRATAAGQREPIANATSNSKYVDTTQCGRQNLTLGPPDELIGAGTLATNLRRTFPVGDPFGVQAAAEQVLRSLEPISKTVRVGTPYIAPGEFWDYNDSLTILAPLPQGLPSNITWRSSIYTETMPLAATWTPVPTITVQVAASYAFVRDGNWDNFLARWYNQPRQPSVGEWCHYTPPSVVNNDESDVESLTLSTEPAGTSATRLRWSQAAEQGPFNYLVYVRGPFDVAWVLRATLPGNVTRIEFNNLLPGTTYRYRVVAQNASGTVIASSNETSVTIFGRLWLPMVR